MTGITHGTYPQRFRILLFDERGAPVGDYPNDFLSPIDLAPGKYVVVSKLGTRYHRVQAIVEPLLTTVIRLDDFEKGRAVE